MLSPQNLKLPKIYSSTITQTSTSYPQPHQSHHFQRPSHSAPSNKPNDSLSSTSYRTSSTHNRTQVHPSNQLNNNNQKNNQKNQNSKTINLTTNWLLLPSDSSTSHRPINPQ
ncbi:uncharacterized protein PGTG_14325 [Puccinia graminis f. sp. tritici CRL 75-36-700-3]|uniref:Uncharacterized protein n=1 Tax=Puccinia graminis f. sp. tritici (strain CRL 75-36-700-3 / race SCCL) TaxID=418459 RepID=E3KVE6_PUCGT|nr:uncharacterized protein PGTG_14325 [Puccinia graminis f. sp. tritici CRL 75-36-700-3]EFP88241.1 hypothetical protein PGTG_14325 [Puccinia graminis f. sp. tritici CRL 75-36-700-3]